MSKTPSFERFTDRARKTMALANQEAQRFGHEYVGCEHILLGLIKEGSGIGANVLRNLGVDLTTARLAVEAQVKAGPASEAVVMGKLPQRAAAKDALCAAIEQAKELNHNYVGTEHILLGLLVTPGTIAQAVLTALGLDPQKVRDGVMNLLGVDEKLSPAARVLKAWAAVFASQEEWKRCQAELGEAIAALSHQTPTPHGAPTTETKL